MGTDSDAGHDIGTQCRSAHPGPPQAVWVPEIDASIKFWESAGGGSLMRDSRMEEFICFSVELRRVEEIVSSSIVVQRKVHG